MFSLLSCLLYTSLIGEHIDYHGGLVLPVALSIGTYGAYSLRDDDEVRLYSTGYSDYPITINLGDLSKDSFTGWANYVRGVFQVLKDEGYHVPHGLNLYLESDMPKMCIRDSLHQSSGPLYFQIRLPLKFAHY